MQVSFTVTLNSKEAAILNNALRTAANHSYSLSRKATERNKHHAHDYHRHAALVTHQLADRICIAHANAQEIADEPKLGLISDLGDRWVRPCDLKD